MLGEEFRAHGADILRLVAIKAGGADEALEFLLRNRGIVLRRAAALEEVARHKIHALVGALRAEHRGHEQFQRM
jgi:hypothetical protein